MNNNLRRIVAVGIGLAVAAGCASTAGVNAAVAMQSGQSAAAAEPVMRVPADAPPAETKKPESARPPVQPAPAESRTPEEASKRAADPRDPSGALIIAPAVVERPRADR